MMPFRTRLALFLYDLADLIAPAVDAAPVAPAVAPEPQPEGFWPLEAMAYARGWAAVGRALGQPWGGAS
jgi:hypothetical protein